MEAIGKMDMQASGDILECPVLSHLGPESHIIMMQPLAQQLQNLRVVCQNSPPRRSQRRLPSAMIPIEDPSSNALMRNESGHSKCPGKMSERSLERSIAANPDSKKKT